MDIMNLKIYKNVWELRMKRKQTIPSRIRDFLNCCPLWVELSLLIVLVITLVLHVLTCSNYTETKDLTISNYQSTTERILSWKRKILMNI